MVLRPGHVVSGDWLVLGLEACGILAFALFAVGVSILIFSFFSKWASRLIDNGPLAMWSKQ